MDFSPVCQDFLSICRRQDAVFTSVFQRLCPFPGPGDCNLPAPRPIVHKKSHPSGGFLAKGVGFEPT